MGRTNPNGAANSLEDIKTTITDINYQNIRGTMEILSPAGSPEGLVASVAGGCDAVYMGGKAFSARAFSDNFTDKELEGAVAYAHDNGVKAYVAVNTLIKDSEMDDALSYVRFLQDIGADAMIVQDLGLLKAAHRFCIKKHASTQMGIHTREGLEWCAANGIDRAILARELTFEEIESMIADSPVETEVFVQGALCYCMSGGCLFSSVIGGRSGNRGQCAQPCRKKYSKDGKSGYLLSSADVYGVEWLKRLGDIGVSAAKIEGRMRSAAYAYLSSKVYSDANKGIPSEENSKEDSLLKTVFNRGFCEGYLPGVISPVQYKYADNRGFLLGETDVRERKIDASQLTEEFRLRDGLSIFRGDDKIGGFKVSDPLKITAPFPISDGRYEIYRTYDPRIDEIKNLVGPAPKFSGIVQRQIGKRAASNFSRSANKDPDLSFYVNTMKVLESVLEYADRIYYDADGNLEKARVACEDAKVECVAHLPRFTPVPPTAPGPIMVNTVGQVAKGYDGRVYGSNSMNMFNSDFPSSLYQTTISTELSKAETEYIAAHNGGRLEVMVFGRTEIMCTRDPGMTSGLLTDEAGYQFPVYKDSFGLSHFLNSSDLLLLSYAGELKRMGINSLGIDLRRRPALLARTVAKAFAENNIDMKGKITEMCGSINYGAYLKGIN
ncbi:MAG: U32 family peptidase [Candidatus Methanoplasma sp.]|jgi:putative protease|nr:U32 family peptidase [Candidatus Methanoplasma sp.]